MEQFEDLLVRILLLAACISFVSQLKFFSKIMSITALLLSGSCQIQASRVILGSTSLLKVASSEAALDFLFVSIETNKPYLIASLSHFVKMNWPPCPLCILEDDNLRRGRQNARACRRCINSYVQLSPLWAAVMMALEGEY